MPELPEVENLRRGLQKAILGQKIGKVFVHKPKLVSGKGNVRTASGAQSRAFVKGLTGERFAAIERRAKNLIFIFKSGKVLLVHLKMSGQFAYRSKDKSRAVIGGHPIELSETTLPNKHSHVIFELERGTLYYNDTRMFGYLLFYPDRAAFEKEGHFHSIGVEPLDAAFTPAYLRQKLAVSKKKIKTALMEQGIVAGLGNIYADEALFEAGIRPVRRADSLRSGEAKKLHAAIRRILTRAIKVGGSSVATYRLLDESRGNYAREHKVYGRAGEKCPVCGQPLLKTALNGRTTVFCRNCQR